jgi:hypothetical protein
VLPICEEVNNLALNGGGTDSRHLLKSAESRDNGKGITEVQNLSTLRVGVQRAEAPVRQCARASLLPPPAFGVFSFVFKWW